MAPAPPSASSIREGFLAEHAALARRLDGLVEGLERGGELDVDAWARYRAALLAHLDAEDGLIAALGEPRGARVILHEHRFLRQELAALDLRARSGALAADGLRELGHVLAAHARNDDRLLYAAAEEALAEHDRGATLAALTARLAG